MPKKWGPKIWDNEKTLEFCFFFKMKHFKARLMFHIYLGWEGGVVSFETCWDVPWEKSLLSFRMKIAFPVPLPFFHKRQNIPRQQLDFLFVCQRNSLERRVGSPFSFRSREATLLRRKAEHRCAPFSEGWQVPLWLLVYTGRDIQVYLLAWSCIPSEIPGVEFSRG